MQDIPGKALAEPAVKRLFAVLGGIAEGCAVRARDQR